MLHHVVVQHCDSSPGAKPIPLSGIGGNPRCGSELGDDQPASTVDEEDRIVETLSTGTIKRTLDRDDLEKRDADVKRSRPNGILHLFLLK